MSSTDTEVKKSGEMPNYMNEVKALSQLIQQNSKPAEKKERNYGDSKKEYLNDDCSNFKHLCALENDPNFTKKQKSAERAMKKLLFVSCICFMFMLIEAVGGFYIEATAILADAAHMFSDVAGFMISFVSIYISKNSPNFTNNYGYHRVEVLGAVVSVMFIWALLVGINIVSIIKIIEGNTKEGYLLSPRDSIIFLIVACFGLGCNLLNLLALNCFCNGEDDEEEDENHSSVVSSVKNSVNQTLDVSATDMRNDRASKAQSTSKSVKKSLSDSISGGIYKPRHVHRSLAKSLSGQNEKQQGITEREQLMEQHESDKTKKAKQNMNMRAAIIHIIGDMIQSVGVITAGIIIVINPAKFSIADPICTFLFTILVLMTTIPIFKDCIAIILEKTPTEIDTRALYNDILGLKSIEEIHDFHCWQLGSDKFVLTLHVRSRHGEKAIKDVNTVCQRGDYGIFHVTTQVEAERSDCSHNTCVQLKAYE